jgi:transposase
MKFNQSQVLLAIIVTEHGLPIGYEIYEGSTYEGHTLKDALKKLEERFGVKDITFVADSALLSKANIQLLEQMQKQYILGARLKNLPKEVKEKILDKDTFTGTELLYKEIPYNGKRLIVTLSPMKAKKDAHDRQKAIDNLLSKLDNSNPTAFISNFGYKRFIKIDGDAKVKLDEEKIQENARWDGIHGVITNNSTLTPAQVIEQYHGLWQVEETFRITKHDIKVRPIFHWTPKRIKAHIAICFIALCLIRHLQFRMKVVGKPLSAEKIRRALISAQASIVKDIKTNRLYGIPSVVSQHTKEIYKAIGIKINAVPFTLG